MFNKSVDSIVSVFTNAIADLTKLEETQTLAVADNSNKAAKLLADSAVRTAEIARSKAVREKLLAITAGM